MGKGVLIVDDAAFMRMVIRDILEKNGYEVAGEAKDGKEAVAVYKEKQPALVLLDITMPEMDGIAALKQIMEYDSFFGWAITSVDSKKKTIKKINKKNKNLQSPFSSPLK